MNALLPALLGLAYLVGAAPLGDRLARRRGLEPRAVAAHNVGAGNTLRLLGRRAVGLAFLADLAKGALPVALVVALGLGPTPALLAALAAYLGHLYPPSAWFPGRRSPRGRGQGVFLGALLGLATVLPWPVVALPLLVAALVLAATRLAAAAAIAGALAYGLAVALAPVGAWGVLAGLVLAAAVVWRHKENLGRMMDGTEPRLGDALPLAGERADVAVAAFIIHPLGVDDLFVKSRRFAMLRPLVARGIVPGSFVGWLARFVRPIKLGELRGIRTADGVEVRCHLLSGLLLPEVFKREPDLAVRRAVQGARLAHELGASTYGLGAFFGTVGKKGLAVQEAVPEVRVTNGGAYTAGTIRAAVPQIIAHFRAEGRDLKSLRAAVVGANGVVAFGMARIVAAEVGHVTLIGRDLERLERSKSTLERAHPNTTFVTSLDPHDCREADLIFTATSDPNPVIFARDVKPGAWIYDEGRPADVDESVLAVPGVRLIPGGVVKPPGSMTGSSGWATGLLGFGNGQVPACLAETLIIAANEAWDRASLGDVTKTEHIAYFVSEAERLGFRVVDEVETAARPEPVAAD